MNCIISGCSGIARGHGLCSKHYTRMRVHGDPLFVNPKRKMPADKRIIDLRDILDCYAIELTQGYWALVSPCDIEQVRLHGWIYSSRTGYATASVNGKQERLHRWILGHPLGEVDHINNNRLDCRRENLRVATRAQNAMNNSAQIRGRGFKGAIYCWSYKRGKRYKRSKPWMSRIKHHDRIFHLGYFLTPEEAARAYDIKARELFGEFAHLNFPHS